MNSKWVRKQRRQPTTSTTHLAQKLLMNVQCKGGSSFAKETIDDEEQSGGPSEVDSDQLRVIIKADPLKNYMRICQRTQH